MINNLISEIQVIIKKRAGGLGDTFKIVINMTKFVNQRTLRAER